MSYRNKTTGEIISDEEFQTRFGGLGQAPAPEVSQAPQGGGFLQRLKLSFGGPTARSEIKRIEEEQGTRGRLDVGDIADVAGAALPTAGAIAGTAFGGPALGAIGAGAGQGLRRIFGGLIGADRPTVREIGKDIAYTGIGTYLGGKALGGLFSLATKAVPTKLMATIFKQSADDIAREVKTSGADPTQATEILKEGFRGDTRQMMVFARETMDALEQQTQGKVAGKFVKIDAKEAKNVANLISDYVAQFKPLGTRYGFEPHIIKEGEMLAKQLSRVRTFKMPAKLILDARRFLDSVRRTSSFKANAQLSPIQAVYKNKADVLRNKLAEQVEGLAPVMNRWQIHINAFEDLAKYAAKTQNKDLFDIIDVFIMYGIDPTAYLARRGLSSAFLKTNVAQGLFRGGQYAEKVTPPGLFPSAIQTGVRRLFEGSNSSFPQ